MCQYLTRLTYDGSLPLPSPSPSPSPPLPLPFPSPYPLPSSPTSSPPSSPLSLSPSLPLSLSPSLPLSLSPSLPPSLSLAPFLYSFYLALSLALCCCVFYKYNTPVGISFRHCVSSLYFIIVFYVLYCSY